MSFNEIPAREVVRRVFVQRFSDVGYTFKELGDERAPVYLPLPMEESANRVFPVGTLTEKEGIGGDNKCWRGHIVDPTGVFFVYAGRYQSGAVSALHDLDAPAHVAVVGEPRTYEADGGSINVSVRPESITEIDAATCDHWVTETADKMLDRVAAFNEEGDGHAWMAHEHYSLDPEEYKCIAIAAFGSLEQADELSA